MWFKNTTVYRLPDGAPSKADLADALLDLPFAPCLGLDWFNEGFDSAAAFDDAPVFEADGSLRLALKREEKVLPAGVIRSILDEQVAARQQAGQRQADLRLLAEDDPVGGFDDVVQGRWRCGGNHGAPGGCDAMQMG